MSAVDERFYFEIGQGASIAMQERNPSVSYCENHNGDFDYGLAALDFQMAAEALIAVQRDQRHVSNWTAPLLHLIRQTLELKLKALLETIRVRTKTDAASVKFDHDLDRLWSSSRKWLIEAEYRIEHDQRLTATDALIENFHAIDPTGDLFRFGTSRKVAFGRQKSSDRVGFNQDALFAEFQSTCGCLDHWTGVLMREVIQEEEGWEVDPYFDRDDFPKATDLSDKA